MAKPKSKRPSQPLRAFRPILEILEDRCLLNATQLAFTPNPITTLANVYGAGGYYGSVVMDGSGNLYGFSNNYGTIFEIAKGTETATTLASLNGDVQPSGLTIDSSGDLFGTTLEGGTYGAGDIFELTKGSSTITTLASFTGRTGNGGLPRGLIVDSNGNLFGATTYGGTYEYGTLFELAAGSSTITTLASFANNTDIGGLPDAGVTMDSNGNLFGTTSSGGAYGGGTVYELANGSSTITPLASFGGSTGNTGSGYSFSGVVVDSSDNLYGTTEYGGTFNAGTVFEVTTGSGIITNLASFSDEPGSNTGSIPYAGLVMDGNGNLFGTTSYGGLNNAGTVFELAQGSNTITTLAAFNRGNGVEPEASVILDSSGNIYGTTAGGDLEDDGTVFELPKTPTGQVYTAGQVMSPYLQVNVEDADGNVVGYNGPFSYPVTMSVTSGPGSFASGSTTTEYGPMTTFYNLILDTAGNYTLTASDTQDGLTPATTNVTINPAAASQLVITQTPGTTTAGQVLSPSLQVSVEDQYGNVETTSTAPVTISVASGPGGFASGTTTVNAVNGVATFSNLVLDTAGSYTLTASDTTDGLTPATTAAITVNAALSVAPPTIRPSCKTFRVVKSTWPHSTRPGAPRMPPTTRPQSLGVMAARVPPPEPTPR